MEQILLLSERFLTFTAGFFLGGSVTAIILFVLMIASYRRKDDNKVKL